MAIATQQDYGNAFDAIFTGGALGALSNTATAGTTSNPANYGQGIVEWALVLVAIIALVVAYEADSRVGSGLLVIVVLLMLYSAHSRGVV